MRKGEGKAVCLSLITTSMYVDMIEVCCVGLRDLIEWNEPKPVKNDSSLEVRGYDTAYLDKVKSVCAPGFFLSVLPNRYPGT